MANIGDAARASPFGRHFTATELGELWRLDESTIGRMFQDEPGVLKIGKSNRRDGKRNYLTLRIPEADPVEMDRMRAILEAGVRLMEIAGIHTAGVWFDLDGPEVRSALRFFGCGEQPVRYLDGEGIPPQYKIRRVDGELVPLSVLAAMERNLREPWKVRDAMLAEMRKGIPRREAPQCQRDPHPVHLVDSGQPASQPPTEEPGVRDGDLERRLQRIADRIPASLPTGSKRR